MQDETTEVLWNREAEEYIIGSLMIDPSFAPSIVSQCIDILGIDLHVFYTKQNQLIYEACIAVSERGEPCNPITVATQLKATGDIGRAGGGQYLYDTQAKITETDSTPYYCKMVAEMYLRRKYRQSLYKQNEMIVDLDLDMADILIHAEESKNQMESQMNTESFPTMNALEIMTLVDEETPSIIPEVISQGLILIAGQAKSGKSMAALNLALAACQGVGGKIWGHFDVTQTFNTLYIACEGSRNNFKSRINSILQDQPIPDNLHIYHTGIDKYGFRIDNAGLKRLEKYINDNQINLVIIDTLAHVMPKKTSGNAYEQDSEVLIPVERFVRTTGCSIILIHHTRKTPDEISPMNEISGSMGMQALPDTLILMKRGEGNERQLIIQGREILDQEFGLEIGVDIPGIVQYRDNNDMKTTGNRDLILNAFSDHDEILSPVKIMERTDIKMNSVKVTLRRMVADGFLESPSRGKYTLAKGVDF